MHRLEKHCAVNATVVGCQAAVGITAVLWLLKGAALNFTVACIALLLTVVPGRCIADRELRQFAALVVALLVAAHIGLGMYLQFYETSAVYDKLMHAIGSAGIAAVFFGATRSFCHRRHIALPVVLLASLVFAGTVSAGTLWEIFEFGVDRTGLFVAQRSLQDTMIDLIADVLGAVIVLLLLVTRRHFI